MKKALIVVAVILVGIQFIPVNRSNPPITYDINALGDISKILRTSCYDCHSNETNWRWYAYIAPVSFFVTSDVENGRRRINFSEWDKYDDKKKDKILQDIIEEVENGEMPLMIYTFAHPNAALDPARIKMLDDWVNKKDRMERKLRYE